MSNFAPLHRIDRQGSRFYVTPDGTFPSVTHILSVIAKPALLQWMAKTEREMVVEVAANLWDCVPTHPKKMSRTAYVRTLQQRIGVQKAGKKALEAAQNIGTQTHGLIEWNLRKELGQVVGKQPVIGKEAAFAFSAFESWRKTVNLRPIWIEQAVYSRKFGYAGTLDLVGEMDVDGGRYIVVLDWKTGKAIYAESLLQNSSYAWALVEMEHADTMPYGMVVRFPKTPTDPPFETRLIKPTEQEKLVKSFVHVKQVWLWVQEMEAIRQSSRRTPDSELLKATFGPKKVANG